MVSAGPMPGSTPTNVPERDADRRVEEVLRLEHRAEAAGEVAEDVHQKIGVTPAGRRRRGTG